MGLARRGEQQAQEMQRVNGLAVQAGTKMQVFSRHSPGRAGNTDGLSRYQAIRRAYPNCTQMPVGRFDIIAMPDPDKNAQSRLITGLHDHALQHTENRIAARRQVDTAVLFP